MQRYATKPAPVESRALDSIIEAQASLKLLVERMKAAMAVIAEEAGAYTCTYCGEYTTRTIVRTDCDEFGESEGEYCPRCVSVPCPF